MNPIQIHTQLDSTTLTIPEIAPLVGKRVTIIVQEEQPSDTTAVARPGTGDWEAFEKAVDELRDTYDFEAYEQQREIDRQDAERTARLWDDPRCATPN
jgi:hypothetical protein